MIPPRPAIDLNADAGEGYAEEELFRWISTASVACGGHAGDRVSMGTTLALARACGVAVGAHPGYEDRADFGRVERHSSPPAIAAAVERQLAALADVAAAVGIPLAHVKPHGALYHRLGTDARAAAAVVAAIARADPGLAVVGAPGSRLLEAARATGLAAVAEAFADRRYGADGGLAPRSEPGAVLGVEAAAAQAEALALAVPRAFATLCLHSDSPGAPELARRVRQRLEAAGLDVEPFAAPARRKALAALHVVGAAILAGGRVLLTRRGPALDMAGKWEFPGGKVEPDEAPAAALAREVAEELGLAIEVGDFLGRGSALVAGRRIVLDVYAAASAGGEPRLAEHDAAAWVGPGELDRLDWPEADLPILAALARRLGAGANGR